jgi:AP-1 complex subunit beta-1
VRKAIRAIGQTAVKIDAAAERCVNVLLELIATRVSYVVQEAVVVMKDIFRKYPATYEGVIPTLCAALDELDEPEAKASLIWIIGEHAGAIANAGELLALYVDGFGDEAYAVQLQTLTAVVKLFLRRPDGAQALVQRVLDVATKECDSPDVRDRAYIYWRLLSTDPAAAKAVVLAPRPPISLARTTVSPALLEELLGEISTLASVYHKPAATFVGRGRLGADAVRRTGGPDAQVRALQTVAAGQQAENLLDFDDEPAAAAGAPDGSIAGLAGLAATAAALPPTSQAAANSLLSGTSANPLDDLVSIFGAAGMGAPAPTPASVSASLSSLGGFDSFGMGASPPPPAMGTSPAPPPPPSTSQGGQEDLLGLF